MAAWTAEQYRQATQTLTVLTTRADYDQRRSDDLQRQLDEERALGRERDRQLEAVRTENALLRQRLDDHLKRTETTDARRWTLAGLLIAATLSFAGNIAVALIRK